MSVAMAQLLIEQRKNLESQAREIIDTAETEKRELTAEENVKFDKISADMTSLRSRSDQLVQFESDAKAAEEALRKAGHDGKQEQRQAEAGDVEAQLRKLVSGELRKMELKASPEELRALSKGTAAAGGNTVPTTFYGQLIEHMTESAALINAGATVLTTTSGENIDLPVTTSHGTAALVTEGGTIGGTDPAFGKRTLGAFKYGELILVPTELAQDTAVDLEGYLARMAGRAVGNALGAHLISGTGTGQPLGLFNSTTLGATSATGTVGAPTFDNIIDLFYSVIGPYRNSPNAGWLIKDSTAGQIRKLKDTSGRYLWEASTVAGQPDLILAKPVQTDPNVAATALNAKSVAFGDLSAYYVRLVNGIRFERSDDFKFDTDTIAFRALIRGDGVLADQTGAVKHLAGAAT
ncbi:phage major capsid protein [Pseudarthrobacter sp. J64]|uniref:phage major capsid protein n=1 Tax=Pseudarthrobacter sp. J64 TaxID=3116485 RepID=UPI002E8238C5|nr:phage major capsid protein [Pseudarthrobacter sp. J64]MEE2568599.1 phage major capsid protein [Pseudarthrobacter sp. J64]